MTIFKFALTLLLLLLSAPGGLTEIIRVKKGAAGTGSGESWTNAVPELRDALPLANPGDEVWVASGRYTPDPPGSGSFQIPDGVEVYGGFLGSENIRDERNPDPLTNDTILDGDLLGDDAGFENRADNSSHVVVFEEVDSGTILEGFTIRGGEATGIDDLSKGGGIFSTGNPTLRHLHFTRNRAVQGGAMASLNGGPLISGCRFTENEALENSGAISLGEGFVNDDTRPAIIEDSVFQGNTAASRGGAIHTSRELLQIRDCRFAGNSASSGGALYLSFCSSPVVRCIFLDNSASAGGALSGYDYQGMIRLSRFLGNTANSAGACSFRADSSPEFQNCLFSGNEADRQGGAIFVTRSELQLVHCTVAGNSSPFGGGLVLDAEETHLLQNCILWGNHSYGFPSEIRWFHDDFPSSLEIPDNRLNLADASGGLLVRGGIRNRDDVLLADPRFLDPPGPDGIVGTEDDDLRTGSHSPAHGTGVPSPRTADSVDLDGNPRLVAPGVDLGAFEASVPTLYFPDVCFSSTPLDPSVLNEWVVVAPGGPSFFTEILETTGTLAFVSPPQLTSTGDLSFEVAASTSGAARIAVSAETLDGREFLGEFSILVSPMIHFVDVAAPTTGNGSSWNRALPRLSDVLHRASQGDEIRVAQGTYYPAGAPEPQATFRLKNGVSIQGGFAGHETGERPDDPTARSTLSGDFSSDEAGQRQAYHVVSAERFDFVDEATVLDSLTITGGLARDLGEDGRGAGLLLLRASPTLKNIGVINNTALEKGGGIYFSGSTSKMDRCFIGGNAAFEEGAGVFIGSSCDLHITNSILSGNRSEGFFGGGGMSAPTFNSNFTLINTTVSGNSARRSGGGIANRSSRSAIYNSIIYGNTVDAGGRAPEMTNGGILDEGISNTIVGGGFDDLQPPQVIDADPLFVDPDGPDGIIGTLDDDYRLLVSSPALNAGDSSYLPADSDYDFRHHPRIAGSQVDIGATEGPVTAKFELLFPNLNRNGDSNRNGIANFIEYATGGDPRDQNPPLVMPEFADGKLTFAIRNNASDVFAHLQKSNDLESWTTLTENVDYTLESPPAPAAGRDVQTLQLIQPLPRTWYFRQLFAPSP